MSARHARPRPRRLARALVVAGLATATVLASAGMASAFWSAKGSGTGTATTGTLTGVTFTTQAIASPVAALYPTTSKFGLQIVIKPSTANFRVTSMSRDTSRPIIVTPGQGACDSSNVSLVGASMNTSVTTGGGNVAVTVPNVVSMATIAPATCQGARFEFPIILTGVLS